MYIDVYKCRYIDVLNDQFNRKTSHKWLQGKNLLYAPVTLKYYRSKLLQQYLDADVNNYKLLLNFVESTVHKKF